MQLTMTKDDAIAAVRDTLPSDMDVIDQAVQESEHGWLVFVQTKRYIETKDSRHAVLGPAGTIVDKRTGRLIPLGLPPHIQLQMFEAGYLDHDDFDLVVTSVADPAEAARVLETLEISYVVPELEHGRLWHIPRPYSATQIRERIRELPCRFNLGSPYRSWETLEQMKGNRSLEFVLEATAGLRNGAPP
jgi:hypothetical protein